VLPDSVSIYDRRSGARILSAWTAQTLTFLKRQTSVAGHPKIPRFPASRLGVANSLHLERIIAVAFEGVLGAPNGFQSPSQVS
jgi:hypothetical protein